MADRFMINPQDKLPTGDELSQLLVEHNSIQINYNSIPNNYVGSLTYALPDFWVHQRVWDKSIFLSPSIHNSKIIQRKEDIFKCAKSFREDATKLMKLMSKTFDINLETLDGLYELKHKKSHFQRGQLSEEWNYYFHGAECQFENIKTGQIVEVIIVTRPEFGYLDCYFFYNYMTTSPQFKVLANWLDNNHSNVCKAIDLLAIEGTLTRVSEVFTYRNVIAL